MKPHVKNYLKHFDLGMDDVWYCEVCRRGHNINNNLDLHHIVYRSHGGSDEVQNIICVCRHCHDLIHNGDISKKDIQLIHNRNL